MSIKSSAMIYPACIYEVRSSTHNLQHNVLKKYTLIMIIIISDIYIAQFLYTQLRITSSLTYYYPAFAELPMGAHKYYKEYIPAGYPWSRETIVDKMPCLRAYAPSGIRTHDPLITSREHEPLHHSSPTL